MYSVHTFTTCTLLYLYLSYQRRQCGALGVLMKSVWRNSKRAQFVQVLSMSSSLALFHVE